MEACICKVWVMALLHKGYYSDVRHIVVLTADICNLPGISYLSSCMSPAFRPHTLHTWWSPFAVWSVAVHICQDKETLAYNR